MKILRILITAPRRVTNDQLWDWLDTDGISEIEDACCCPNSREYDFEFAEAIDIAEAQKFETEFLAWIETA